MTAPTLKPCPFCGSGSAMPFPCYDWPEDGSKGHRVVCNTCNACGPVRHHYPDAARDWNDAPRPTPPSPDGRQLARVRIAVAVDDGGRWNADTWGYMSGALGEHDHEATALEGMPDDGKCPARHVVWVTALVPLPPREVQGEVESC